MVKKDSLSDRIARVGRYLQAVCVIGLLLSAFAAGVQAQDDAFTQAKNAYGMGEFEQATELFATLARDETVAIPIRREALRYLGHTYIAQSLMEDARKAVVDLLELEPPLAELDPDIDPPPLMDIYFEERKKRTDIHVPRNPGLQTMAIMDFRNYALDDRERWDPMQWGFSSMMIEQLSGATDLKLVDRENLQWVLKELDLQKEPGRVDQATAVRMGGLMGVHAMVFGGIYIDGRRMRLSARVVKVETSEILLGESVEGRANNFYELVEALSLKVARSVNSTFTETEIGARTETRSLDAARSYADGLKLAEDGRYEAAHEKFMEALELDPSYERARSRANSLVPILAARTTQGDASDTSEGF